MAYDGTIAIQTKLVTDKFDKQIVKLEENIKREEEKAQLKLKAKLQAEDELKRHKQAIFEVEQEYEKTSQQVEHLQNLMKKQASGVPLTPQEFMDIQSSKEALTVNEKTGKTLDNMYAKEERLNNSVEKTNTEYKQAEKKAADLKKKIEEIKLQKQKNDAEDLKKNFKGFGDSIGDSIKHIGRLALGIFSVASAYRLVSAASSTLGQYDEQYATNLEYIRYLIAQAIAPALKYVVNLASTLLSYLNYIVQAWFGITLFSKNSAKNFMKAKNSTGGISKNTGKIKKDLQTTPFDEMNILTDTSDSGASGGAGSGAIAPSIDPSMLQGEVPDWLKWIADNKDLTLSIMAGISAGLLAWKLGLEGIKALGIGVLLAGIVYTIKSLLDYLKDPSWENFGKIIQGIGIAIMGLGILIAQTPVIVAGAIVLIVGTIVKYWEQIKAFLQKGIDWLKDKSDWVHEMFGDNIGDLYDFIVDILQNTLNSFDGLFKGIKTIFDGIIKLVKGVFTGDWKTAWEGIKQITKGVFDSLWSIAKWPLNMIISGLNTLIRGANRIHFNVPDWVPVIGGKQFGFNIPQIPKLAKGTILNAPGRGVPVAGGTALAGEAGREAYLPLSDTQLLEELGSTIGKYINLNATIPIYVGNRQIAREIKKINTESDFAFNR